MTFIGKVFALAALLASLTACGGGGGGSNNAAVVATPASPVAPAAPVVTAAANAVTITVDAGPPVLDSGSDPTIAANLPFVSVTLCAPGTTNCQTIDHVEVDTGSVGLRIEQSVLSPALLAALPQETDASANPLGECYGYVDGYVFGSVRQADFQIGGEAVAGMPLQVIGDGGAFAATPSSCSAGGGDNLNSVKSFGANGIIGIGVTTTDCGASCATAGGYAAAIYYDCPSSGCGAIVAEAASTTAPFQQLPNPVAAMAVDNNGAIISLPAAPASGTTTLTGTLYFGIGTQTNNALGSATVLTVSGSADARGGGFVDATYNGADLPDSSLDSGTSLYLFVDGTIPQCTASDEKGYYCPASPLALDPRIRGLNGAVADAAFTLYNAHTLLTTSYSVLPGLGANPNAIGFANAYPTSFDFGLPFFYGRRIYTALEGRTAGGVAGPYVAY